MIYLDITYLDLTLVAALSKVRRVPISLHRGQIIVHRVPTSLTEGLRIRVPPEVAAWAPPDAAWRANAAQHVDLLNLTISNFLPVGHRVHDTANRAACISQSQLPYVPTFDGPLIDSISLRSGAVWYLSVFQSPILARSIVPKPAWLHALQLTNVNPRRRQMATSRRPLRNRTLHPRPSKRPPILSSHSSKARPHPSIEQKST